MSKLTYRCPCGKHHDACMWVADHWDEVLLHTCDNCKRVNEIQRGMVLNPPPKRRKKR